MRLRKVIALAAVTAISLLSFVFGASATLKTPIKASDQFVAAYVNDVPADAQGGKYASGTEERAALDKMELKLENNDLALYYGDTYSDIAIQDKRTGHVWFSNRAIYFQDPVSQGSDQAMSEAYSQVSVTFYNQKTQEDTMSSYPDAVDGTGKNQVQTSVDGDSFNVVYTIGQRRDNMLLFSAMLPETYEKYLNAAKSLKDQDIIAPNEYAAFQDGYGYYSLDDQDSDADKQQLLKEFPGMKQHPELYILNDGLTELQIQRLQTVIKALGITQEIIDTENQKVGVDKASDSNPYFVIPVEYRLDGGDLIASIMGDDIQCAQNYILTRINFLPQYAATPKGNAGYMFIPDNSGAIIQNDHPGKDMYEYSLPFYGDDYGLDLSTDKNMVSSVSMPVYGLQNGNTAVVAVMENGESNCGVTAEVADDTAAYNRIKLWYNYNLYDTVKYDWDDGNSQLVFAKKPAKTTVSVRYHFLYGDSLSYSSMAAYYQKYLVEKKLLARLDKNASEISLDLEFLGSTNEDKQYLGFSRNTVMPLTTFDEASEILKQLKADGVTSIQASYSAWFDGGKYYSIPSKVNILKELGGVSGFQQLLKNANDLGVCLYPEVDFMSAYHNKWGTGFRANRDLARLISKQTAIAGDYDVVTGNRDSDNPRFLINPASYEWIYGSFLKSYEYLGNKNLSLLYLGNQLGANYTENGFLDRENTKDLVVRMLSGLKADGQNIMLECGNMYAIPYAAYIQDVPTDSSEVRIEAQSVPFVPLVLRGYKKMSGGVINTSTSYQDEILKTIENGLDLHFDLMAAKNEVLMGANDGKIVTVSKEVWLKTIIETYLRYKSDFASLSGQRILDNKQLNDNLHQVTYEDGTTVYVNYGENSETVNGIQVNAKDYAVVKPNESR